MRFFVVNLGCKVNRVESDAAAAQLMALGWEESSLADADLVVVNTCAVTGEAEKKTRKAVRHALRLALRAPVIVTGCAAALRPAVFESMSDRVRCVPKASLSQAIEECARELAPRRVEQAPDDLDLPPLLRMGEKFPTRVGVKVQDGCNNACTYCIVHVARGRAVSRSAEEIIAECVAYAQAGVREIVLTGINLGSYHRTNSTGETVGLAGLLTGLLRRTAAFYGPDEPACRFRISSVEPRDVDNALVEVLASADGRVCRHLHLPLQSGSSKVLHEMARPYSAQDYVGLVERLRRQVPGLSLSTDIIVGFPGETEDDFAETLDVACRCAFSKTHVFPYSRREGTPAAARPDQVPAEIKEDRASRLRAFGDDLRVQDYASRRGTTELALVEQNGRGMTESYHEVVLPERERVGSLVPVVLGRALRIG